MYLSPTEEDRLRIFQAAELARRTLARGLRLNAPEAVALVCDEMHLAAREGRSHEEVLAVGRAAVTPERVLDGVAGIVDQIRLEVLLEEGSRLIVLHAPFGEPTAGDPGAVVPAEGDMEISSGRARIVLEVTNTSKRPIRVSSHYPFWRANPRLEFDRERARGYRLDVPAGVSVRWAPGESREVALVVYGGGTA